MVWSVCLWQSFKCNKFFSITSYFFFNDMEHTITLKICLVVVRDEYKEFEKLIQEDLQEVDDHFEEEEVRVKI